MIEWHDYVVQMRESELLIIIEEEKLKEDETRKFLENAFREGEVKTVGSVVLPNMTTEQVDEFIEFVESIDKCVYYDEDIEAIINEEVALFFAGQKSASDVARVIQGRVEIYVNESR